MLLLLHDPCKQKKNKMENVMKEDRQAKNHLLPVEISFVLSVILLFIFFIFPLCSSFDDPDPGRTCIICLHSLFLQVLLWITRNAEHS